MSGGPFDSLPFDDYHQGLRLAKKSGTPQSYSDSTGLVYVNSDGLLCFRDPTEAVTTILGGSATVAPGVTAVAAAASPYTVLATDQVLLVDTSAGAVTLTLPAAGGPQLGRTVRVVDAARTFHTAACTVDGNTKTINGSATVVLSQRDTVRTYTWGGTTWETDAGGGLLVIANATGAIGAATRFPTTAGGAVSATEVAIGIVTRTGVLRNLRASLVTAPGGTDTVAFTVRTSSDNGATWAATTLTCTITGNAKAASDLTHFPAVTAGDLLSVQMVSSAGTAATPFIGFEVL